MDDIKRMDIVDIELNSGSIHRGWLNHSIGTGDAKANCFGVRLFRDKEPVSLSGGSVQGFFRNSQGQNIALTSEGTISNNVAYVTLPQACYNYEGQFTLAIKVINSSLGITGTMRIVDGMVDNTNTGSAVAPTGTVPTYQEVLAVYESMVECLEDFNVYKDGIDDEIDEMKDTIQTIDVITTGKNLINPNALTNGYIAGYSGLITPSDSYKTTDFIPIKNGQSITISPSMRKFLAYDSTKGYIQSSYNDSGSSNAYTYTASQDGYIRFSYLATNTQEQAEYGTSATSYEAYKILFKNGIEFSADQKGYIEQAISPVEDRVQTLEDSFEKEYSDKIVNVQVTESNSNTGYYQPSGYYQDSSSYFHSEELDVKEGDIIGAFNSYGTQTPIRFICAYVNGSAVAAKGLDNSGQVISDFTIQSGVTKIIVTLYGTRGTTQTIRITTPNGNVKVVADVDDVLYTQNILYGKKWVSCGDSFTQGDFNGLSADDFQYQSGRFVGKNKVYPYVIALRCGMNIVNEAIGGSTMAYIDGTAHEFSTPNGRYTQIPSDADYITLYFGINDSHHHVPIGTIDDNTNETFYGAWNIVMQYLITNHPDAKIGIIISNGCDTIDYPNAEIAIAKKYGVAYLDMNSDYKVPILFRVNGKPDVSASVISANYEHYRVSSTNGHPNVAMHEYESTIIQHWLESM